MPSWVHIFVQFKSLLDNRLSYPVYLARNTIMMMAAPAMMAIGTHRTFMYAGVGMPSALR